MNFREVAGYVVKKNVQRNQSDNWARVQFNSVHFIGELENIVCSIKIEGAQSCR